MLESIYFLLIVFILIVLRKKSPCSPLSYAQDVSFSIVIPFRNEEKNLQELIESINRIDYPRDKLEWIFVDDASRDKSVEILQQTSKNFVFKLIRIPSDTISSKKYALRMGIKAASHEQITTFDADIRIPPDYFRVSAGFWNSNQQAKLLAGPVLIRKSRNNFLELLQSYEFLALQAFTELGFKLHFPSLANGANLQFKKSAFLEVKGYDGYMHYAGGDDIFLLKKINKKFPGQSIYLASDELTVLTKPVHTMKEWFAQRIRWSKKSLRSIHPGFVFLLFQLLVYVSLLSKLFNPKTYYTGLVGLFVLIILHYAFIRLTASKYKYPVSFTGFLPIQFFLPVIYLISGIKILFGKSFYWKDRSFNK